MKSVKLSKIALYTFRVFLLSFLIISTHVTVAQTIDSTKSIKHFGGAVNLTNNGISLLPTFTLGKPAVMFDINAGNKKLTFEPQLRFALEGKPWSFVFWWRYKVLNTDRFQIRVGAHPAIVFKTVVATINGSTNETQIAQRYLAGEFVPNYSIKENISVGIYYLHSIGFDEGTTRSTNFFTINANFSNLKLSEKYFMKFNPQIFYLKLDQNDGYYATATITLVRHDFPLSMQSIVNQAIKSSIITKSDFVWNLSLIYSFNKEYAKS